jgi:hypothetical protein
MVNVSRGAFPCWARPFQKMMSSMVPPVFLLQENYKASFALFCVAQVAIVRVGVLKHLANGFAFVIERRTGRGFHEQPSSAVTSKAANDGHLKTGQ